jgi:hypothetical protein
LFSVGRSSVCVVSIFTPCNWKWCHAPFANGTQQRDGIFPLEGFVGRASVVVECPAYFSDQARRGELRLYVLATERTPEPRNRRVWGLAGGQGGARGHLVDTFHTQWVTSG